MFRITQILKTIFVQRVAVTSTLQLTRPSFKYGPTKSMGGSNNVRGIGSKFEQREGENLTIAKKTKKKKKKYGSFKAEDIKRLRTSRRLATSYTRRRWLRRSGVVIVLATLDYGGRNNILSVPCLFSLYLINFVRSLSTSRGRLVVSRVRVLCGA